jgi:hypothetical protein
MGGGRRGFGWGQQRQQAICASPDIPRLWQLANPIPIPLNPSPHPQRPTPQQAFIGRLDFQKGADLLLQAAPWLMSQGVQLVCLGTGTPDLEVGWGGGAGVRLRGDPSCFGRVEEWSNWTALSLFLPSTHLTPQNTRSRPPPPPAPLVDQAGLRWLEQTYPNQARGWVGFNVAMSHKMTAAADILMMPSRFEPCGLNQLYAMRYGTGGFALGGLFAPCGLSDGWAPQSPRSALPPMASASLRTASHHHSTQPN